MSIFVFIIFIGTGIQKFLKGPYSQHEIKKLKIVYSSWKIIKIYVWEEVDAQLFMELGHRRDAFDPSSAKEFR